MVSGWMPGLKKRKYVILQRSGTIQKVDLKGRILPKKAKSLIIKEVVAREPKKKHLRDTSETVQKTYNRLAHP